VCCIAITRSGNLSYARPLPILSLLPEAHFVCYDHRMEHQTSTSILSFHFSTNYLNMKQAEFLSAPLMHFTDTAESREFSQSVKSHLKNAITTSKRRGAWFSLERRERSILSLATRLDLKFSSLDLLRALASILKKLERHGETLYAWLQNGVRLAWAFSEFAVASGNKSARSWRNDRSYAVYLGRVFSKPAGGRFRH